MLIKQAVFTSVRSGRNDGYQLAASSPGISNADSRELVQWGPGHDSLYQHRAASGSVNFHQLATGQYCISRTVLAGVEYSGRGGQRVYTQFFLVPSESLARFANNPFRIMEALVASGRTRVRASIPRQLEPIPLVGRASAMSTSNLERINGEIGSLKLATLLYATLMTKSLGVITHVAPERLFSAVLDLMPPPHRLQFSLTTGLKVSSRRPYRLHVLPDSPEEQRHGIRQLRLTPLSLIGDAPTRFAPDRGWAALIYELLKSNQYVTLASMADTLASTKENELNVLAEEVQQQLKNEEQLADILTPFAS